MLGALILAAAIIMTIVSVLLTWAWLMHVAAIIETSSGKRSFLPLWPHIVTVFLWVIYANL